MGRTYTNKRDDDWGDTQRSKGKHSKHAKNLPGRGMKIINSMSDDEYDDYEDDLVEEDDTHYDNISTTHRKKENQNGY